MRKIELIITAIVVTVIMLGFTVVTVWFEVPVTNERLGHLLMIIVICVVAIMIVSSVINLLKNIVVTVVFALDQLKR